MLVHFPIAFLLGAVALDSYAQWRRRSDLANTATGLLLGGLSLGLLAAGAGVLALYTMPDTHSEAAHGLMLWHVGTQTTALALFGGAWWLRWSRPERAPTLAARGLGWIAAAMLVVGAGIGGFAVYHGGAGIEPRLLKSGVQDRQHHGASF